MPRLCLLADFSPLEPDRNPEEMWTEVRNLRRDGLRQLDLDVHAGSQIELHQRVDSGGVGLHDVEQPLLRAHLKLLTRLLVDVRSTVDTELLDLRRQRNGAPDKRAGAAGGVSDLASRLIEYAMVKRLQANADVLSFHVQLPMRKSQGACAPNKFEARPYIATGIRASPVFGICFGILRGVEPKRRGWDR